MVRNVAEWSAMATVWDLFPTFWQKFRNEIFSVGGFLCTKTRNHRKKSSPKSSEKRKKNNSL